MISLAVVSSLLNFLRAALRSLITSLYLSSKRNLFLFNVGCWGMHFFIMAFYETMVSVSFSAVSMLF